jgi:two-component system LytT family response regulator
MTAPVRRVVIADDEPLARDRLRRLLAAHPGYEIAAECEDGAEVVEAVLRGEPHLVFLDIQMPELTGLAVADALRGAGGRPPVIVFTTAFDQYALDAFEVGALDYLLKPVTEAKLARALGRAEQWLASGSALPPGLAETLTAVLDRRAAGRFAIRDARGVYFVPLDTVDWIEAAGNYVRLHAGGKAHLYRSPLNRLEERLDPARFLRVHRSIIVSVERVVRLEAQAHGEYLITMADGGKVTSSRAYNERLRALLA